MSQLDLPFWPEGTLKEAITSYLTSQCEEIAEATLVDYAERGRWLMFVLGESTRLDQINWAKLDAVKRKHGPDGKGLMYVTLRRRFVFLRACLKFAAARGLIRTDQIFDLSVLKLPNDGKRGGPVHTPPQYKLFRGQLPEGRFRVFADVGFWTGHHNFDLFTTERWMVNPDREVLGEDGKAFTVGAYWRRNHKVKKCKPDWFPMHPDFRIAMLQHYAKNRAGSPSELLTGRLWGTCKTFAAACDRAELPRISPKGLRRSFSSNLLARGVSPEYVRQALGQTAPPSKNGQPAQRSSVLTEHYAEITPELLRRGFESMRPLDESPLTT